MTREKRKEEDRKFAEGRVKLWRRELRKVKRRYRRKWRVKRENDNLRRDKRIVGIVERKSREEERDEMREDNNYAGRNRRE